MCVLLFSHAHRDVHDRGGGGSGDAEPGYSPLTGGSIPTPVSDTSPFPGQNSVFFTFFVYIDRSRRARHPFVVLGNTPCRNHLSLGEGCRCCCCCCCRCSDSCLQDRKHGHGVMKNLFSQWALVSVSLAHDVMCFDCHFEHDS